MPRPTPVDMDLLSSALASVKSLFRVNNIPRVTLCEFSDSDGRYILTYLRKSVRNLTTSTDISVHVDTVNLMYRVWLGLLGSKRSRSKKCSSVMSLYISVLDKYARAISLRLP